MISVLFFLFYFDHALKTRDGLIVAKNMMTFVLPLFLSLLLLVNTQSDTPPIASYVQSDSYWPNNYQAAISLTFDDACFSQVDTGLPILDRYGVRASFYVSIWSCAQRKEGWLSALEKGHEIGNHTNKHPCTGSYGRESHLTLEEYNLRKIKTDIREADQRIEDLLHEKPLTFAYPCGQKFIGSGKKARSYIPFVANHFLAGRSYLDEGPNDPNRLDLSNVLGVSMDDKSFEEILPMLEQAREKGFWLVLVGHHVGKGGPLTTRSETLHQIIQYAQQNDRDFWIAPIKEVAFFVKQKKSGK